MYIFFLIWQPPLQLIGGGDANFFCCCWIVRNFLCLLWLVWICSINVCLSIQWCVIIFLKTEQTPWETKTKQGNSNQMQFFKVTTTYIYVLLSHVCYYRTTLGDCTAVLFAVTWQVQKVQTVSPMSSSQPQGLHHAPACFGY